MISLNHNIGGLMKEQYKKYLPLGSVILIKGAKKRVMITGYATIDTMKKDKVYDYCACLYPEGVISTEQTILFNHDDIERIFCLGFSDEEQKEFSKKLLETLTEENLNKLLENLKNQNDFGNQE